MTTAVLLIMAYWSSGARHVVVQSFPTIAACERAADDIRRVAFAGEYSAVPKHECVPQ